MRKSLQSLAAMGAGLLALIPGAAWAAGGGGATPLVVVADTRIIQNPIIHYFADLYNTDIMMQAVWAAVLTAAFGAVLGFIMDWLMSKTGLDLHSRDLTEH